MKEKIVKIAKQKTTWAGIALIIAVSLGLPAGSGEQIAGLLAGIIGIIYPEKAAE